MAKDTLFTNDSGAAGGAIDYVKDVFDDVSLAANSNSGYTDTALTNPLGFSFGNDDSTRYGAKTLYIKDLILIQDRSRWVSNKPTYQVIFQENFPQIQAYVFGNVSISYEDNQLISYGKGQEILTIKTIADGMGVTGVARRVSWLVNNNTSATATAQLVLDGINTTTIDFSGLAANSDSTTTARFSAFQHAGSNETKDLHDFRITALQANTLALVGLIVYFENSGQNIDQFPGTTYVDKAKVTSLSGAALVLPSYGATTGGVDLIYKTSTIGYARSSLGASTVTSIGQGTVSTNILNLTTGHGASFPVGCGIGLMQGSSSFVGSVLSVSTDSLTLSATLGFGASANVFRAWLAGPTYSINASLMQLAYSIDFSQYRSLSGVTNAILDPTGRYAFYGSNIGVTAIDSVLSSYFLGASGFMQVDGFFSGAEIEMIGNGIFSATMTVNGTPGWSVNTGQTGAIKKTVFTEAGPGWNSFHLDCGSSQGVLGISKVNLYTRNRTQGITLGLLSQMDTMQGYMDRGSVSATVMALGLGRRFYADQLYLKGNWIRGATTNVAGGAYYVGSTTNCVLQHQYYGKDFGILGTTGGGTLTIDSFGTALAFNAMKSVATEGFHTINYTVGSGATAIIQAVDIVRVQGAIKNLQKQTPIKRTRTIKIPVITAWMNDLTFTPNNFGVVTATDYRYRRVGDSMEIVALFTSGTAAASVASLSLPIGFTMDGSKLSPNASGSMLGTYVTINGTTTKIYTGNLAGVVFYDGSDTKNIYFAQNVGTTAFAFDKTIASQASGTGLVNQVRMTVPILGWSEFDTVNINELFQ